jgi:hypothetical protein
MRKLMLIIFAIVGSAIAFAIVSMFVLKVTIGQYLLIELIITASHWLYNKAKQETIPTQN